MAILAVNAGSSSLKFSLHRHTGAGVLAAALSGNIDGLEPGGSPAMRRLYGLLRRSAQMRSTRSSRRSLRDLYSGRPLKSSLTPSKRTRPWFCRNFRLRPNPAR